jgi:hypothetical protein
VTHEIAFACTLSSVAAAAAAAGSCETRRVFATGYITHNAIAVDVAVAAATQLQQQQQQSYTAIKTQCIIVPRRRPRIHFAESRCSRKYWKKVQLLFVKWDFVGADVTV